MDILSVRRKAAGGRFSIYFIFIFILTHVKGEAMKGKLIRSGRESNILEIHDANSAINSYYDMSAPIQFTLTYCSGLSEDDFYNVRIP